MDVSAILRGEVGPAARLMRDLDDEIAEARELLRRLYPHTGRAHVIGITGSPGAGKSCLTSQLVGAFRARGRSVGVVAIDPSSPFSGGAILGDRVRMQPHAGDPGVFVRSLATRGHMGGLSRSSGDVVDVMDAMGKDVIIVSIDGEKDALQAIVDGKLGASVECNPRFGPSAFDTFEKYAKGEQIPTTITNPDNFYDSTNAAKELPNSY